MTEYLVKTIFDFGVLLSDLSFFVKFPTYETE